MLKCGTVMTSLMSLTTLSFAGDWLHVEVICTFFIIRCLSPPSPFLGTGFIRRFRGSEILRAIGTTTPHPTVVDLVFLEKCVYFLPLSKLFEVYIQIMNQSPSWVYNKSIHPFYPSPTCFKVYIQMID